MNDDSLGRHAEKQDLIGTQGEKKKGFVISACALCKDRMAKAPT